MSTMAKFKESPWSTSPPIEIPSKYLIVDVTADHVAQSIWTRFMDPVSIALKEKLNDCACADTFWNSDSFSPSHTNDDAYIGIHVEASDKEYSYYVPLPTRATKAMWKLRTQGCHTFKSFKIRIPVPLIALPM